MLENSGLAPYPPVRFMPSIAHMSCPTSSRAAGHCTKNATGAKAGRSKLHSRIRAQSMHGLHLSTGAAVGRLRCFPPRLLTAVLGCDRPILQRVPDDQVALRSAGREQERRLCTEGRGKYRAGLQVFGCQQLRLAGADVPQLGLCPRNDMLSRTEIHQYMYQSLAAAVRRNQLPSLVKRAPGVRCIVAMTLAQ